MSDDSFKMFVGDREPEVLVETWGGATDLRKTQIYVEIRGEGVALSLQQATDLARTLAERVLAVSVKGIEAEMKAQLAKVQASR